MSNSAELFPMDGNDHYSDCTIAAVAHAITVFNGLIGVKKIMDSQEVVKLYLHLTNGVDMGLPALKVLKFWQSNAVDGEEILAYAKVEPHNHTHIKQAIQLFGGVYLGFNVPVNCKEEFTNGKPWTPGDLTYQGHAVFAVAYDSDYVTVLTWGKTQKATWDWWDDCVDEAYAILPEEAKNPTFAPNFDLEKLQADLQAVSY